MKRLLHDYLTESSTRFPDNTALRFKDEALSYQDLEMLSSNLAAFLLEQRVDRDRIGILLDKSIDAIISIFGVLRAGCCYVPVDPAAPGVRLSQIVEDCQPAWLITSSSKLPLVKDFCTRSKFLKKVLFLDVKRDAAEFQLQGIRTYFQDDITSAENASPSYPEKPPSPTDLAYILYTSGSTGKPKGVMISHNAAAAFVEWSMDTFEITHHDVLSAHAPLHFDLSIFDIFTSIAAGASVCLVPPGWSAFPKTIADFIDANALTTWYSVPSALIQLLLHGKLDQRIFPELRQVLFAGEVFPAKYLRRLMALLPEVSFYNLYGPTETNVITFHPLADPPDPEADIPLGRPCTGVRTMVISESGDQAKEEEIGELYVSGPTLMSGYWLDSSKTARVMVKNPLDKNDPDLFYRTGDLVHRDRSGLLRYHGRRDMMIKTRGYRVELGEIESVLSSHSEIKECAATPIPSDEFGSLIGVTLVPELGADIRANEIRRFCSMKLPFYMVPDIVHIVESLPRTSTGKIDRTAIGGDENEA